MQVMFTWRSKASHFVKNFIFLLVRYKEGMLKARSNDRETNMIIEEAARNLIDTIETDGYNSIEDWEVNELLEWTNMLNFDE